MPTLYLAPRFLEHELEAELTRRGLGVRERAGRLFLCDLEEPGVIWADDVWYDVQEAPVESISKAAKVLRQYRIPFVHFSENNHRRGELILDSLKKQPRERLRFGEPLPAGPWAAFSLPAPERMWISTKLRSAVPLGEAEFEENKTEPPSRAYLKLWEAMTVHGIRPAPGARVLDLGAAPGGWTWVLAGADCEVIAVDKADLASELMRHPRVKHLRESAFGLDPKNVGPVEWLFSDIICYPDRLLSLVNRWRTYGQVKHFVCTVKFQGDTDWSAIDAFLAIPGSRIVHQYANKHELTWIL